MTSRSRAIAVVDQRAPRNQVAQESVGGDLTGDQAKVAIARGDARSRAETD